jgi:hypothetical protein
VVQLAKTIIRAEAATTCVKRIVFMSADFIFISEICYNLYQSLCPILLKLFYMKQFLILLTVVLHLFNNSNAQTSEDSVKATINNMFKGMKDADGQLLRSTFTDSAILQTIVQTKEGKTIVRNESVQGFIDFVSKQKKGAADERINFGTVLVDGPLASVWTPYKFYFEEKFSHCGVNSFQLVRLNGEWKIQYIIDTRRRQGCE